jgi:hypothetical protein
MNETVAHVERILAFIGGIVVFVVAAIALRNDWRAKGLENQVFKLMLALLALGAILAVMASVNFLAGKSDVRSRRRTRRTGQPGHTASRSNRRRHRHFGNLLGRRVHAAVGRLRTRLAVGEIAARAVKSLV